jgi:hypothetical protein
VFGGRFVTHTPVFFGADGCCACFDEEALLLDAIPIAPFEVKSLFAPVFFFRCCSRFCSRASTALAGVYHDQLV